MTARRVVTDRDVARLHQYWRAHGEDPQLVAPEFFLWHLSRGVTDAEMLAIATNHTTPGPLTTHAPAADRRRLTNDREDRMTNSSSLLTALRTSLELGTVALAVAQGDAALRSAPRPETLTALDPSARARYERAASVALMLVNPDADRYARMRAGAAAGVALEDWADAEGRTAELAALCPADGDFERVTTALTDAALDRYHAVLAHRDGGALATYLAWLATGVREGL